MAIRREDTALLRLETSAEAQPATVAEPAPAAAAAAPAKKARPPAARRIALGRVKSRAMGLLWLLGGGAVLGYGATLVYANVARIEVDSAVVSGTVQPVRAPAAGIVAALALGPGAAFGAGHRLFTIYNPELEQSIALATVRVSRSREELAQREAERDAELARRENYVVRARADLARINEQVEALAEIDRSTRARFDILSKLFAQGHSTRLRLEDEAQRAAEARSNLARERIRLGERRDLLDAMLAGHGWGASEVVVRLADAQAAVRRASAEVELAAEELRVRMERRADMAARAPDPGRILRVLRLEGSHVLAGDTVAIMEQGDDRFVYAFLTQAEAGRVALGDEAEILLPAHRRQARARVVAVERSGGYLDDVESRYRWSLSRDMGQRFTDRDRTARVTLRFEGADRAAAQRSLDLGTPAIVSFDRRWRGGPLFAAFEPLAAAPPPEPPRE